MTDETIKGDCSVSLIRENADGSADYQFDFPPEALAALTRLGILTAINAGIAEAEYLNPDMKPAQPTNSELQAKYDECFNDPDTPPPEKKMPTRFTKEIKKLAEEAGFILWDDEHWKPKGAVVDWALVYDKELVKFYHLARSKQ